MNLSVLSVCSGIAVCRLGSKHLGWRHQGFSEIDDFPSALLKYRHPEVRNFGDFTTIRPKWLRRIGLPATVDVLCGGTPCQSFSVAGRRAGLDDPRGNLAIEYLLLARRLRARWVVWENVPGIRSSWTDVPQDERRSLDATAGTQGEPDAEVVAEAEGYSWQRSDLDYFLSLLGQLGYGWSYATTDAQYCGVAQRRQRVFVVGYAGGLGQSRFSAGQAQPSRYSPTVQELQNFSAISLAVLLDLESLSGNPAPSREARQRTASGAEGRAGAGGWLPAFQNTGHGWWNESDCAQNVRTPAGGGSMEANVVGCADVSPTLNTSWGDRSPGSTAQEWDSERGALHCDVVPALTGSGQGVERCGESRGQDPVVAVWKP